MTNRWYEESSSDQDIVVSSRVRLARNISGIPFESKMSPNDRHLVISKVGSVVASGETMAEEKMKKIDIGDLEISQRHSLVEQHLISPQFAKNGDGRAIFLSDDYGSSIIVNEEDHIRIQVLLPGMNLQKALVKANQIDDILDENLVYAFDDKLGFLTGCPTNIGTGLRASVMLHLPMLEKSGYLSGISNSIVKLGLILRGTYGEGTAALGSFYQISNQVTLGISEQSATDNLESIVNHIISQERVLREKAKGYNLEDKVHRAYGLLTNARMISFNEFMDMISLVRLGISLGYIDNTSYELLNELVLLQGPSYLNVLAGSELNETESNYLRAKNIREKVLLSSQ